MKQLQKNLTKNLKREAKLRPMAQQKQSVVNYFFIYQHKYLLIPYMPGTVLGPQGWSGEAPDWLPVLISLE